MTKNIKICPYCGEAIQASAKKCKHCGEWLVMHEKDKPKAKIYANATIVIIALLCAIFISSGNFDTGMSWFLGILLVLYIYFIPTLIADEKRTSFTTAIFWINLLLGYTVIGWIACLVWALSLPDKSKNESELDEDEDLKKDFENILQEFNEDLKEEKAKKQSRLDNIPKELQNKFNWGAFLWNWIWGIAYKQPITLLIIPISFIPILGQIVAIGLMIWFGKKGNLWAWEAIDWSNAEEFNKIQRKWAMVGVWFFGLCFLLSTFLIIAAGIMGFTETDKTIPSHGSNEKEITSPTDRCKKILGKTKLMDEDIIICGEDYGIWIEDLSH